MAVQIFSINIVKFKSNSIQTEFQQTLSKFHIKVQNHQNCSKSKTLIKYHFKIFKKNIQILFDFTIQIKFHYISHIQSHSNCTKFEGNPNSKQI